MSLQSFYCILTMNKLKDTKLLHIKDLFQFSTKVSIVTEFGGQMGVGGGSDWWGQTGDNSSIGVAHKTILKDCRGQVSGKGISRMPVKELGGQRQRRQTRQTGRSKMGKKGNYYVIFNYSLVTRWFFFVYNISRISCFWAHCYKSAIINVLMDSSKGSKGSSE